MQVEGPVHVCVCVVCGGGWGSPRPGAATSPAQPLAALRSTRVRAARRMPPSPASLLLWSFCVFPATPPHPTFTLLYSPALPMAKHANLRTLWSGSRHSVMSSCITPEVASSP